MFITKVLPLCPAAPKTQTEVRGKFRGGWEREVGEEARVHCVGWPWAGREGLRAPFIPTLARARSQHTAVATRSLSLGMLVLQSGGGISALCRCTGAKSHPAGADGQAGAAEPAVQDASCPRGAAGITPVVGVGTPATSAPALWSFWPGGLH